jgi:hypothetical protein
MASSLRKPATNRVVRLTMNADSTGVANRQDIIDDIPFKEQANGAGSARRPQRRPDPLRSRTDCST